MLTLERAVFGSVEGAHGVRTSTFHSSQLATLAMRLDLPDQPPVGVAWQPYLAGFPFEDTYVFAYVRQDGSASRGGMVISDALVARLSDIGELHRLDKLAGILKNSTAGTPVERLSIAPQAMERLDCEPLSVGLANTLATHSEIPAILVQGADADEAIFPIWQNLLPSVRANFSFRLSFAEKDLVETPRPSVIFVPQTLQGRWPAARIARREQRPQSSLASALCGTETNVRLAKFIDQFGAVPGSIEDLILTQSAIDHLDEQTFSGTLAGLRLLERLSPNPDAGKAAKSQLVKELADQLQTEPLDGTLVLRNVRGDGFGSLKPIWNTMSKTISSIALSATSDAVLTRILSAAQPPVLADSPWRRAVIDGLAEAAKIAPKAFSSALWQFGGAAEALDLLDDLESPAWTAHLIADARPSQAGMPGAKALESFARRRGLKVLFATALRAQHSLPDVFARYTAFDPDLSDTRALDALLEGASGQQIVNLIEKHDERVLLTRAANAIIRKPTHFRDLDFRTVSAQRLLAAALADSEAAWLAMTNPRHEVSELLRMLCAGDPVDHALLKQIARSDYADLSETSERATIWAHLPARLLDDFLQKTSEAWLHAVASSRPLFALDDHLRKHLLLMPDLARSLATPLRKGRPDTFWDAVNALPDIQEQTFGAALDISTVHDPKFTAAQSTQLGKLVADKGWESAATKLKGLYDKGRKDLKPALQAAQALLPSWTRYSLGLATPSVGESWDMLRDIAVDLYPSGPDREHLWRRAGGKDSELATSGTGSAKWYEAIEMIRKGNSVRVDKLLREMKNDYPNNQQLDFLSSLSVFRSRGTPFFSWLD